MSNFGTLVTAIVVEVADPDKDSKYKYLPYEGKVKIRVPVFHQGPDGMIPDAVKSKQVPDKDLPWAHVVYPLSVEKVSLGDLLSPGDLVYVIYNGTSYRHPVILGSVGLSINLGGGS